MYLYSNVFGTIAWKEIFKKGAEDPPWTEFPLQSWVMVWPALTNESTEMQGLQEKKQRSFMGCEWERVYIHVWN